LAGIDADLRFSIMSLTSPNSSLMEGSRSSPVALAAEAAADDDEAEVMAAAGKGSDGRRCWW
jgi:hypothetical protein